MPQKSFRVGDKIVDFGQVFRVFKVEQKKNDQGEPEQLVYFKPYYKTKQNQGLVCSIPTKNIEQTQIRRPVSKNMLQKLLQNLSQKPKEKKPINTKKAHSVLNLNDIGETIRVLRRYWLDKKNQETNLTKAKKDILELSQRRLVEEIAFVLGIPVTKAREKVEKRLQKLA